VVVRFAYHLRFDRASIKPYPVIYPYLGLGYVSDHACYFLLVIRDAATQQVCVYRRAAGIQGG
jgi:hypothetical protein